MAGIRIEKVGDVNRTYAHLEVFETAATSPFLEISITEEKTLCFKVFPIEQEVTLTSGEWERILAHAQNFMPKAIANEEYFQQWYNR